MSRTASTNPPFSFAATPGPVFVAGLPTLRITRVGGFDVPELPVGDVDVTLPVDFPIGLHWHHYDAPILPPIVSPAVRSACRKMTSPSTRPLERAVRT